MNALQLMLAIVSVYALTMTLSLMFIVLLSRRPLIQDKHIDEQPLCKRDNNPCGLAGGFCLECPCAPKRSVTNKPWMIK